MPDLLVDFADWRADGVIVVHDTAHRKKPLTVRENVRVHDANGNACYGFIEKADAQTRVYWIALDRSTYTSVVY